MSHVIKPIARGIAASAMLGAIVLGTPSPAAAQASATQAAPTQNGTAAKPAAKTAETRMSRADRVEARIKDLHDRLRITPAQEPLWNNVAQAMRDDAKAIETIAGDRVQKVKTMSALDDLRSYESLAQAHADGLKKLVTAFAPLYDAMSDSQKKSADEVFRHHERHRAAAKKT
jgi:protein CpxP